MIRTFWAFTFSVLPLLSLFAQEPVWHIAPYPWSLGFALNSDITLHKPPYRIGSSLHSKQLSSGAPGSIVWIQSADFHRYYLNIFPNVTTPFVYVLGGSDKTFPDHFLEISAMIDWIEDPRVIHVFAQNNALADLHPKVSSLPIGLDFHTLQLDPGTFGMGYKSISEQVNTLQDYINRSAPTQKRIPRVICDFHLCDRLAYGPIPGTRAEVAKTLNENQVADFIPTRIARDDLWSIKSAYAFSASPHGNGLDCHRTWEDLILGCIVIVKTSPLDCLYDSLPVVIVNDWSEVTQEKLDQWLLEFGNVLENPNYRERLTHRYWMDKIRQHQQSFLMQESRRAL